MVLLCAHFDATHSSSAAMRADHQITEEKRRARVEIELHVHLHVTRSCPAAQSANVLTTEHSRNRSTNSELMDTASRTLTKIVACDAELNEVHNCSLVSAKNCGKCECNLTYVPVSNATDNALRIIPCLITEKSKRATTWPYTYITYSAVPSGEIANLRKHVRVTNTRQHISGLSFFITELMVFSVRYELHSCMESKHFQTP
jgi:hypothetical protein